MQLTFKDLKQQKFTIEADPSDTISAVKEKIFKNKQEAKEWDPSLQKLIYSGKILADDKTVEFYKVEEKGFIVCMLQKPKAATASSSSTPAKAPSTPAPASKPATPAGPARAPPGAASTDAAPPATPSPAGTGAAPAAAAAAADPTFNDPSALALGAQREAAISNMLEMGFERADIDRAMRAAFFNPDRAVEYLMTGIPENVQAEQRQQQAPPAPAAQAPPAQPAAAPAAAPAAGGDPQAINLFEAAAQAAAQRQGGGGAARAGGPGGAAGAGGVQGLDFLRNNPQFQQLRNLVQQSPQMLEPILQQVGQGNPQLAALISQNPDAFLQLLSEGVDGDEEGEGGLPPGFHQVQVTPEEAQAIDRLCNLGFQRDMVVQAYFACDKNEELTANYLFDNGDDLEDA